jgi:hypothetical protein
MGAPRVTLIRFVVRTSVSTNCLIQTIADRAAPGVTTPTMIPSAAMALVALKTRVAATAAMARPRARTHKAIRRTAAAVTINALWATLTTLSYVATGSAATPATRVARTDARILRLITPTVEVVERFAPTPRFVWMGSVSVRRA